MRSVIVLHPDFDRVWPFAADHFRALWEKEARPGHELDFTRLDHEDRRPLGEVLERPETITRLVCLHVPVTAACLERLTGLEEAVFERPLPAELAEPLQQRGVKVYVHRSRGFWRRSIAEMAIGLTICALRRIAHLHSAMITDPAVWKYSPPGGRGTPGGKGAQFYDDPRFANGTIGGKRVRIVGAGNIGSTYARITSALGADVAIWDPYASDPCFHLAGARREHHLERLVEDADIFAPMVPLFESTRGLITAELIDRLPKGALVVLVTRAGICDMQALRRRVLADELSLAADVFDEEPLPLDDPLLGRHNVTHTPHIAGRTKDANLSWAEALAAQFRPRGN